MLRTPLLAGDDAAKKPDLVTRIAKIHGAFSYSNKSEAKHIAPSEPLSDDDFESKYENLPDATPSTPKKVKDKLKAIFAPKNKASKSKTAKRSQVEIAMSQREPVTELFGPGGLFDESLPPRPPSPPSPPSPAPEAELGCCHWCCSFFSKKAELASPTDAFSHSRSGRRGAMGHKDYEASPSPFNCF